MWWYQKWKSISISIPSAPLYDYLGLCGIYLYIPIVFTTTANDWEQKWKLHVGVVLAEKLQVFPFLKIKPPPVTK